MAAVPFQTVDASLVYRLLATHPEITSLDLSGNVIGRLEGLEGLAGSLTSVDLSNNRLTSEAAAALSSLTALRALRLGSNQL